MGYVKRLLIEELDLGFKTINKFVCTTCVQDRILRKVIKSNLSRNQCTYCGRKSRIKSIAAPINLVIAGILEGLNHFFRDTTGFYYSPAAGGYPGKTYDAWDLSRFIQVEAKIENQGVLTDITTSLEDYIWCEQSGTIEEALDAGWYEFANLIKYERRYTLYLKSDKDSALDFDLYDTIVFPKYILKVIAKFIRFEQLYIKQIPVGTTFYRARWMDRRDELTAKSLGTTPRECAIQANRMSPIGIAMFYGALDKSTAIKEIKAYKKANQSCAIGNFKTSKELNILDLTISPRNPSLFDKRKGILGLRLHF